MSKVDELIAKARAENKTHPEWDYRRCDKRNDEYEAAYEQKRNRYLTLLSDFESITLGSRDAFDRLELIRRTEDHKQARSLANNIKTAIETRGEVHKGGALGRVGLGGKNVPDRL